MQEKKERFHGIPMLPYGLLSAVMQERVRETEKKFRLQKWQRKDSAFEPRGLSAAHRNWKFVFMIWRGQNTGL